MASAKPKAKAKLKPLSKVAGKTKTTAKSKPQAAGSKAHKAIAKLFSIAVGAPSPTFASQKSAGRLFELVVLEKIISKWKARGPSFTVDLNNKHGKVMKFAGSPASADASVYSFFTLRDGGNEECQVWVSVEVSTLSWSHSNQSGALPRAAYHEIDVGVFAPNCGHHPSYEDLIGIFSCKHRHVRKEHAREALGLRRETALLQGPQPSRMAWFEQTSVPADPPSPLYLVGSSKSVNNFKNPLWALGVYTLYEPYTLE